MFNLFLYFQNLHKKKKGVGGDACLISFKSTSKKDVDLFLF